MDICDLRLTSLPGTCPPFALRIPRPIADEAQIVPLLKREDSEYIEACCTDSAEERMRFVLNAL